MNNETLTPNALAERYTVEDLQAMLNTAEQAARTAQHDFLEQWNTSTGGNQYGEPVYCGFAWVNIHGVKGNTKIGRRLKLAGVQQSWDKSFQVWNPGSHGGQSMDVKEAGARAYADVLTAYGFTAYPGSRAD